MNLRREYIDAMTAVEPKDMVFIDECGSNAAMTREYGRGPKGERVHDSKPGGYSRNLTIIGALTLEGLDAMMTIPEATSGPVFLAYVRQVLVPTLRAGQLVIMDNLSAHKVPGVREAIEGVGARVTYQPPYSPDLNPIEKAWSKLKNYLRSVGARTLEDLSVAVGNGMRAITPLNCAGWFRSCGYALST